MEHLKRGNWEILLTSSPCHRGATGTGPAWEPHWLRENAVLQGLEREIRVREIAAGNNRESTFRVVAKKCNDWNLVETQWIHRAYISACSLTRMLALHLPQDFTGSVKNNCQMGRT